MAALVDTHTSTIRLHSVPWTDYKNVPDWSSQGALDTYFTDNYTDLLQNMTIVRPDTFYDIQMDINTFMSKHINYMTFDNGNGRQYAFLKNPRFISLNTTRVDVVVDVWTTYLHKHNYAGTVEVGHVNRWAKDAMIPNPYFYDTMDVGQLYYHKIDYYQEQTIFFLIFATEIIPNFEPKKPGKPLYIGRSVNTLHCYLLCDNKDINLNGDTRTSSILLGMQKDSALFKSENIVGIYALPFVPWEYDLSDGVINITEPQFEGEFISLTSDNTTYAIYVRNFGNSYSSSKSFDTYFDLPSRPTPSTPASWKYESRLYGQPFSSIIINNYADSLELDPFLLSQYQSNTLYIRKNCGFGDYAIISQILTNWNGDTLGINKQMFDTNPISIPFATDKFYNYYVQNESQIKLQMANTETRAAFQAMSSISSALVGSLWNAGSGNLLGSAGNVAGAVQGVAEATYNAQMPRLKLEATYKDSERWPKNLQMGSGKYGALLSTGRNKITISYLRARPTVLENAASKFIQYGYTINQSATNFNYRSRYWFNFVQYGDCVCTSDSWLVPEHKEILENIYKAGVRIWHYRNGFSQFGKYNLDNTEV